MANKLKVSYAICNYYKRLYNRQACSIKAYVRKFGTSSNEEHQSIDLSNFPVESIRNFSIIAHVDHGKSTLADRLLEFTGTISKSKVNKQVLDKLQVERERGITVKAQTASIVYKHDNNNYLLNLIDTPGHVDFTYEVSRSLSACQGVLLLVDASQGVQAQTIANFYLTMEHDLQVIPILNKIDLKTANVSKVKEEVQKLFDISPEDVISVSAKHGTNVEAVLQAIVERLPAPNHTDSELYDRNGPLKALLFDSNYEQYRGVIANLLILNGTISKGDIITSHWLQREDNKGKTTYEVKEVGVLRPDNEVTNTLYAGQVGYIVCGMKNTAEAQIGDTIYLPKFPVTQLPGFKEAKPVVFGSMFPNDQSKYKSLQGALNKLSLNDRSVQIKPATSSVLGPGFRIGFLGLLHMDVFQQRLEQEFNESVILTPPNVIYKAILKPNKKKFIKAAKEIAIQTPSDFPEKKDVIEYSQPIITATIVTPTRYESAVTNLCMDRQGEQLSSSVITDSRVMLQFRMPMNEIMTDFYDKLKAITSGYASYDYDEGEYEVVELVKINFLLNGDVIDELSYICPAYNAKQFGTNVCTRLKELLPREIFKISIQASVDNTIIARETLPALRKDVLAKCYGGDYTRKLKLLRQHANNQKKLREMCSIKLPKNLFIDVLKWK